MSYPWPDLTTAEWEELLRKKQHPRRDLHGDPSREGYEDLHPGGSRGGDTSDRVGMHEVRSKDAARVKALRVPPAWTNVRLSDDPDADLQAVGTDAKGRTQYLYSAKHSERAAAEKFARVKAFHRALPGIRETIDRDLAHGSATDKEAASVLYLIDKTAFRIGSDAETLGDKHAYGASTLEARHVKIDGDKLVFRFTAKKGVPIHKTVRDAKLAEILRPRVEAGGRLFEASDADVRDYLKSKAGDFKVKDFRTWHGTAVALKAVKSMAVPKTPTAFKKAQREVTKKVARQLGNTPAVAKASYIDPAVWGRWKVPGMAIAASASYALRRDAIVDEPDEADMDEFVESVRFDEPAKPWQDTPETEASEDEPETERKDLHSDPSRPDYDEKHPESKAGGHGDSGDTDGVSQYVEYDEDGNPYVESKVPGEEFSSEAGYKWHEEGPGAAWVKDVPDEAISALTGYAGFGYGEVNRTLRGSPPTKTVAKRQMTAEEIKAWEASSDYDHLPIPPEGKDHRYEFDWTKRYGAHAEGRENHFVVVGPAVDEERKAVAEAEAAKIDAAIRDHGLALPDPITVYRAAYLPGITHERLLTMVDREFKEPAFTSTMLGNAGNRLDGYVAWGKWESIMKRHGSGPNVLVKHQDEDGVALRIKINLPKGAKVGAVEAARQEEQVRRDQRFAKEYDRPYRESEKRRTESEILLGSGARFRITKVKAKPTIYGGSDPSLKPVSIIDVEMDYVGGGSSEGT